MAVQLLWTCKHVCGWGKFLLSMTILYCSCDSSIAWELRACLISFLKVASSLDPFLNILFDLMCFGNHRDYEQFIMPRPTIVCTSGQALEPIMSLCCYHTVSIQYKIASKSLFLYLWWFDDVRCLESTYFHLHGPPPRIISRQPNFCIRYHI